MTRTMKKKKSVDVLPKAVKSGRLPLGVSVEALAAFLEAMHSPSDPEACPEAAKLAKVVARRSSRLGQDGARCRKFYQKMHQDPEFAQAVQWADLEVLAERIARAR